MLGNDRFQYVEYSDEAMEYIAGNLRAADRDEIHATVGHTRYADAIRVSVAASDDTIVAITAYGEPAAILGVTQTSVLYNIASPWFLATPTANRFRRALISGGRAYTAAMLERYARLENFVDARNTVSVAWLQHLGYCVDPPAPHGVLGLPFHRFSIVR